MEGWVGGPGKHTCQERVSPHTYLFLCSLFPNTEKISFPHWKNREIPFLVYPFKNKWTSIKVFFLTSLYFIQILNAHLHRRFLSRQLNAIFVAAKLQQVSSMFETPVILWRQIAPGLHVRFWSCNLSATKIASSCHDKNCLCKRALMVTFFLTTLGRHCRSFNRIKNIMK